MAWPARMSDSLSIREQYRQLLLELRNVAYWAASIDRIHWGDSVVVGDLYRGARYEWLELGRGNVEEAFLDGIGFRDRLYQDKVFQHREVLRLQEALLNYAEDHGYPFAVVGLDSLQIGPDRIRAQLRLDKGPRNLVEGIERFGETKISDYYLENYLGLREGTVYSEARIKRIRNRIQELPFLREQRDATVTFRGQNAKVNLFLERQKASRWDFLLGVLPQNNNLDPELSMRPVITASLLADMHNQLGLGEKIFFRFQQLQPQRQQLEFQLLYPYLLDLPFGFDGQFNMYRRDTAFLDVSFALGLQYLMEAGNYFRLFWRNTSSILQIIDTSAIIQSGRLPDVLDVRNSIFGLEYQFQKLDYRYYPRKGWSALLRGGAVIKRIRENSVILSIESPTIDPAALYDSLVTQSFQYSFDLNLQGYLPLFRNSTLRTVLEGGGILSRNPIYRNEQYRLGGNRRLRGFAEESINATNYLILTLEYRLLIGTNSNFYVFGNVAYLEDLTIDTRQFDRPYGFGAGLTFETKVGLFGFSLAVGSQRGNPVDFRNVKSHFGYVNYF